MGEFNLHVAFTECHADGDDGISRVSARLRLLPVEVTEFRVIGVTKLEGLVPGAEKQLSLTLMSVEWSSSISSSSVASYRSSKPCICSCHSVSEHEEVVSAERGDIKRASRACVGTESPLVFSVNLGLIAGLVV